MGTLPELFCAKSADTIEAETEEEPILVSQAHVERVVLGRNGATVPGISQGHCRTNQRTAAAARTCLKVEEEGRAAKQSAFAVSQKD